MHVKHPRDSETIMTEIVLPNDTNVLGNLRGGKILHWMDVASAISCGKHANATVVTVSVDNVSFQNPIRLGDVVTIKAKVVRVFKTSMECFIDVWAENLPSQTKYKCNEAFYTFVALDSNGRPRPVPPIEPETDEERQLYEGALKRRQIRLLLAGRLKPEQASELKNIFL
ncbi:MAG: acyl-CoA thioesterase [Chitinophagales bacterium]|nr:MAG: acyl-CoA thioesterase [Chitinophagales bacterium]